MSSQAMFKKWCEVDFEFLGNVSGQPYVLQTNVYIQGVGAREQQIYLWFDPTADFHEYGLRWNQDLILFWVDNRVIRVFHNATDLGLLYLDYQPMYAIASIWNGEAWATEGGRIKVDWTQAPFIPSYTGWNVSNACKVHNTTGTDDLHACYRKVYQSSYGRAPNLALSQTQIADLRWVKQNYVIYDYCTKNATATPECARNWP
ncbi:xyloglucan:xyloglucosyl transferase [Marchantia polymorpha subsp. ruderalis]